tara:strand:+ start:2165 stop:2971 length:807 start_codon:yes stop_codon:yes gene_type:complete
MQSLETKIEPSTNLLIKLGYNIIDLILSDSTGIVIQYVQKEFSEKLSPEKLLKKLDLIINESVINISSVIGVKLIVLNKLSTLVPRNLFDENLSLDYLKFNSKLLKNDYAAYDLIEEIGAVNVFLPFVNVNNYLIEQFGSFNYYHYSTILIKKLLKYSTNKDTSVYVNIQLNDFQILIFKNKNLQYYNNFEFKEKEDILYFTLFVMEQNKIDNIKTKLLLLGNINEESDTYLLLSKFIKNIDIIKFQNLKKFKTKNIDNIYNIDYLII